MHDVDMGWIPQSVFEQVENGTTLRTRPVTNKIGRLRTERRCRSEALLHLLFDQAALPTFSIVSRMRAVSTDEPGFWPVISNPS
jgi:hypothetical protein